MTQRARLIAFPKTNISSFAIDRKNKEIVVTIPIGDDFPTQALVVLQGLQDLVNEIRRGQSRGEREIRVDERLQVMRRRHIEVARTYQRLRLSGLKHRAAIRAVFIDPAFADLHASTADISYWVQVYALGKVR